jgi:hypothetical protein
MTRIGPPVSSLIFNRLSSHCKYALSGFSTTLIRYVETPASDASR